ncbi:hypothetical protein YC2023_083046 [Brassica napus]
MEVRLMRFWAARNVKCSPLDAQVCLILNLKSQNHSILTIPVTRRIFVSTIR